MKKILYFIILALLLIPTYVVNAERICNDENDNTYTCKVPKVDNSKKVYDYADLLSDTEEKDLFDNIQNFIERYKMDLVIVTINENPYGVSDKNTQIYAQDFYYYSEFGFGNTSDGLIVLIDMANRYPYIATRGQAILVFDDERISNIHNNAYNYLKAGSYYNALNMYIKTIENYAESGISSSNKNYCIDDNGNYYDCTPKSVNWLISSAVALGGSLLIAFIHTRKYRGIKLATNANSYLKGTNLDVKTDQFLTTFTSRIRRSHDSGGGGSHGGSSTSHGSGGSFGGGGGRHF